MNAEEPNSAPEFDAYAKDYDTALQEGISVSGEDKEFFAQGRVKWLADRLRGINERPGMVLDFGCGTGTGAHFLADEYPDARILGVDISTASLETARKIHPSERIKFCPTGDYQPAGEMDLVFCNGVFHHIPIAQRAGALALIHRSLRAGGLFSFWENNPWNPGTRYIMSRIPFDRDAITLTPPEARGLLTAGGFDILRTDFLFIFPKFLGWFRLLEPALSSLPMGAQYLVLARKRDHRAPTKT